MQLNNVTVWYLKSSRKADRANCFGCDGIGKDYSSEITRTFENNTPRVFSFDSEEGQREFKSLMNAYVKYIWSDVPRHWVIYILWYANRRFMLYLIREMHHSCSMRSRNWFQRMQATADLNLVYFLWANTLERDEMRSLWRLWRRYCGTVYRMDESSVVIGRVEWRLNEGSSNVEPVWSRGRGWRSMETVRGRGFIMSNGSGWFGFVLCNTVAKRSTPLLRIVNCVSTMRFLPVCLIMYHVHRVYL